MISKAPPHNLDAEQAVLGGIFLNNDAMDKIIKYVKPTVIEPSDIPKKPYLNPSII